MQLLRAETGWDTQQLINLLILIMVFSGVFGFIYEVLFYRIDLGYFTKRGSSYGPWIPIYVFGGWVLYEIFHTRLWDYNTEIWNWGNIKGYVCFRSVLFFGISGVLLVYMVIPMLIFIMNMIDFGVTTIICRILAALLIADGALYQINHRGKKNGFDNGRGKASG